MKKLFEYQEKIVKNANKDGNALFMQMGTGKTVTSLALFKKSACKKLLVLCLVSKLNDWVDDIKSECNLDATLLNKGSKKNMEMIAENNDVYVINFESAWRAFTLLDWVDEDTFVLIDESHKIKTHTSKIGKFCEKLRKLTPHKVILTGTPQSKGYIDYYHQLKFVDILDISYKDFCKRYCVYEQMRFNGYPFNKLVGYQNTEELEKLIQDECVFYDRKVDDDMVPTDIDVKIPLPSNYKSYKRVRVYKDVAADSASRLFVDLRTLCSGHIQTYKTNENKIQWLKDLLEDLNQRVVIFYNFNVERDDIVELCKSLNIPYSEYNGREKDLTNFKENENGVAICQYISASTGLNDLVASYICVMYSPTLNYSDWAQARKRIDRIGQTKKPLYYNLYCVGSVEEKILDTVKSGKDFDDKMFENYLLTN